MMNSGMQDVMLKAYVDKVFDKYDVDKSGTLDTDEMTVFFNDLFKQLHIPKTVNKEQSIEAIKSIDKNYDGNIDKSELFQAFKVMLAKAQQQASQPQPPPYNQPPPYYNQPPPYGYPNYGYGYPGYYPPPPQYGYPQSPFYNQQNNMYGSHGPAYGNNPNNPNPNMYGSQGYNNPYNNNNNQYNNNPYNNASKKNPYNQF